MKKIVILMAMSVATLVTKAQVDKDEVAALQSMFGKDKKEIMAEAMVIPEDKKAAFWSLYDEYEAARNAIGRERIDLVNAYINGYAAMDDKKADDLMGRKLKWLESYTKMQGQYYKKMSKLIGGMNASRFFQLEDYLENNIRVYIQESIPFIGELDKTRKN